MALLIYVFRLASEQLPSVVFGVTMNERVFLPDVRCEERRAGLKAGV